MAELGYYQLIPVIYGTANRETDSNPEFRAALQADYFFLQCRIIEDLVNPYG